MRKLGSLFLAMLLCLSAVSAHAETAKQVSSAELWKDAPDAVSVSAMTDGAVAVNDERAVAYVAAEIAAMLAKGAEAYFAECFFVDAEGRMLAQSPLSNQKITVVTTIPLRIEKVLRAENGAVKISSALPDIYAEILRGKDVTAVYTYSMAAGRVSAVIPYEIVRVNGVDTIVYQFPEAVARGAEGLNGMINFLIVEKKAN